jgi:GGDEF domain-containing protein
VIVNRDITERKRAEQQLEYNLFHDLLTGLPNRRMFMDRLQSAFGRGAARRDEAMPCCWRMWITSRSSTKRWGPKPAITS